MDYKLIDSGHFRKLEQVGPYRLIRPSAQAVWGVRDPELWQQFDAEFVRFSGGNGEWKIKNKSLPKKWTIQTGLNQFVISLTDFGHLGIFPEQYSNWNKLHQIVKDNNSSMKVLNLFAYTGGSTFACASGGAEVVHLDASKTSVNWARENAEASGLGEAKVRWIVDDVQKFVEREVRRGSQYHGMILDPPTYGRGSKNEVWDIEKHLTLLLDQLKKIKAKDFKFILLSSHSPGYTPIALKNLLLDFHKDLRFYESEMLIEEVASKRSLPSGTSCLAVHE